MDAASLNRKPEIGLMLLQTNNTKPRLPTSNEIVSFQQCKQIKLGASRLPITARLRLIVSMKALVTSLLIGLFGASIGFAESEQSPGTREYRLFTATASLEALATLEQQLEENADADPVSLWDRGLSWYRDQRMTERQRQAAQDEKRYQLHQRFEGIASQILRRLDLPLKNHKSLKVMLADHPYVGDEVIRLFEEPVKEEPQTSVVNLLEPALERLVVLAVTRYTHALAIDLTYKLDTSSVEFLEAYARAANIHPESATNYSRATKLATYRLGFEKGFSTASAEWMQFLLHADNHTPTSAGLVAKIPAELWAIGVEPPREESFVRHYGHRIMGPADRINKWRQLYELNSDVLNLFLEELRADDQTDFTQILQFLRQHQNELTDEQQLKLNNAFAREAVLDSLPGAWPEAFEPLSEQIPDDLEELAYLATTSKNGAVKLLALRKLANTLPTVTATHLADSEIMQIRSRYAQYFVSYVQLYASVRYRTVVPGFEADYEALAKYALILMQKLTIEPNKIEKLMFRLSEEYHSAEFELVMSDAMRTWNIRKMTEEDIALNPTSSNPSLSTSRFAYLSGPPRPKKPEGELIVHEFSRKQTTEPRETSAEVVDFSTGKICSEELVSD